MESKQLQYGYATEEKVKREFQKKHYWVYVTPKKINGQPVDVIAFKGKPNIIWLVDAKHVEEKKVSFDINRIEPNQWTSLQYAIEWANVDEENVGFAIEFDRTGGIYWLPYKTALEMSKNGQRSINLVELKRLEQVI